MTGLLFEIMTILRHARIGKRTGATDDDSKRIAEGLTRFGK